MIGWRLLKRLNFISRLFQGGAGYGLYSVEEFRAIIDRERTRCDRNSHEFSLVVFTLGFSGNGDADPVRIAEVLGKRVRCTDEVGWFDSERIGVVLPDTSTDGARKFADDATQIIEALPHPTVDFSVYTYPSQDFPGNHRRKKSNLKQLTFLDVLDRPKEAASAPPVACCSGGNGYPMGCAASRRLTAGSRAENTAESTEDDIVSIYRTPVWKRAMDVTGALIILTVWAPFFWLMALWIKLVSPGPVFYKQQRIGASGKPFTCWKVRTMAINSDESRHTAYVKAIIKSGRNGKPAALKKMDARDNRIIPLGKLIRNVGLDELPQLFNVLHGEMSLVGPRPALPYEYEEYSLWHVKRCDAIPGLTGLWQVSGKNRTTFKEMMRLDIKYSRQLSFWLDVKILLMTVPAIIGQIRR